MAFPFDVADIVPWSDDPWLLVRLHLEWLAFNSMLGLVPWLLARWLFRPHQHHGPVWIVVFASFICRMPNLAYLLTDVIHIPEAVADTPSSVVAVSALVPVFVLFIGAALAGFVDVVRRTRNHLLALAGRSIPRPVDAGLCLIAGCGVVVGRVTRFQTWDLVRDPMHVIRGSVAALAAVDRLTLAMACAALLLIPVMTFDGRSLVGRRWRAGRLDRSLRSAFQVPDVVDEVVGHVLTEGLHGEARPVGSQPAVGPLIVPHRIEAIGDHAGSDTELVGDGRRIL